MSDDLIRYDLLVQDAMRDVMRRVLMDVAATGALPGEHHFTIIFRTDAPGVKISARLKQQWPLQMTIILQYQFADLFVDDEGFGVTLFFRGTKENLYVPFVAVSGFFDPSVDFGLRFDSGDELEDEADEEEEPTRGPHLVRDTPTPERTTAKPERATMTADATEQSKPLETPDDQAAQDSKIVSIDAFRKKT